MNKEEQQAEKFWAYQAKQENLQRMVDKGWGDREEYNKLLVWEDKQRKIKKFKKIANEVFTGLMFIAFVVGMVFLTGCSSTSGTTGTVYGQAPSQQLVLDKQVAGLTRNEVIHGVTECEGAGLRAHVITTKRSINGFSADIPVEVTCMPKYKY
jgi:transcription antitermination factor NusG